MSTRHKDVYEDILEDRRLMSDVRYSMRTREVPKFRLNKHRTPDQIKGHVLKSDRVQFAIEQVSLALMQKYHNCLKSFISICAYSCF